MYTKYTMKAIDDSCDRFKEMLKKIGVEPEKIEEAVSIIRELNMIFREEDLEFKRERRKRG